MFKPAAELARMVREAEITSRELVEASFERIEALQPEINAFVHVDRGGRAGRRRRDRARATRARSRACRSR